MEPKSSSKSKFQNTVFTHNPGLRKSITFIILMILISGTVWGYSLYKGHASMLEERNSYFTVVLDCGSTGSRVNVHEWVTSYGNLPVLLRSYPENVNSSNDCQYHCMQTEPGLQNFVNSRFKARDAIEPLIRYAEHLVLLEKRSVTPIFVLATAGMRMLVVEEAEQVLRDIENVVKRHGFLFKNSWIRVLSGKEEAYYGWVALNYKMGMFQSSMKSSTLGLLDLGGSSLQVVVEVDDDSMKDKNVVKSKLGPFEHDIAAYSLPTFGLNEAFDRTVIMLSHSQALRESINGKFEIRHPCLGSGFIKNYTCNGCFALDFRDSRNVSNKVQEDELKSVFLIGDPDWDQCKVIARAAAVNASSLESVNQVHRSNCIGLLSYGGNSKLDLTKSSHTVRRYHALSGFYAVYHALNLRQTVNLTKMWESGQRLCSATSADQTSIHGQNCFRVPYLTSLIENALCLGFMEIIFGPGDVSWTLGASLIEGEFLWLHDGKSQNRFFSLEGNEVISSSILTFVLLSSLLLIVYYCQIKLPMPSRKIAVT